ncbi:MAG TPA: hypothetical protein VHM48_04585 [Candidatus Limnocylindrales bacterium]|nr:hypothetical protein [Candidatus Limnocylindrales bacterium]
MNPLQFLADLETRPQWLGLLADRFARAIRSRPCRATSSRAEVLVAELLGATWWRRPVLERARVGNKPVTNRSHS